MSAGEHISRQARELRHAAGVLRYHSEPMTSNADTGHCKLTPPTTPPPGSDAAAILGCTCPVMDNGCGRGYMGQAGVFVQSSDCPLHGDNQNKFRVPIKFK